MSPPADEPLAARASALAVIGAEHAAFDRALASLVEHLTLVRTHQVRPDPGLFERSLVYLATFMDRFHHPKEDDYLFAAVRRRTNEADDALASLQRDHADSPRVFGDLALALAGTRDGETAFEDFGSLLERYARSQLEHMQLESHGLVPLAERVLRTSDWQAIDAAFRANRDPFFASGRFVPSAGPGRA